MLKSKFFRVAVEGATATDGRTIERSWLEDIAGNYKPETYGARVNMEHIRGFSPQPPFNAYGDVLAVKAEEVTIELNNVQEKRLALFAEIAPTPQLVTLTKDKQKIYTSIEVAPNFANTGKAYLVGLAVTDSPASLGTDILQFSAKADDAAAAALKAAFDSRKQDKANHFSAALETSFEFVDVADAGGESALEKFAKLVMEKLTGKEPEPKPEPKQETKAQPEGGDFATMFQGLTVALAADRQADRAATDAKFAELTSKLSTLKTELESTAPQTFTPRPIASGDAGGIVTDC